MHRNLKVAIGVTLASIVLACGSPSKSNQPNNAANAPIVQPSPVATKPGTIGNGTWVVGEDVKPGTYRSPGATDSSFPFCSWQVKTGKAYGDMGTSGEVADPQLVTLQKGQQFETSGCGTWTAKKTG